MSWADYVNGYLVNYDNPNTGVTMKNICEHGAIIGNTNGVIWASTPNFYLGTYVDEVLAPDGQYQSVKIDEFANLQEVFANCGNTHKLEGVRLVNVQYIPISFNSDAQVLWLRKKGGGACVAKTSMAFVIATFEESRKQTKLTNIESEEEPQNFGMISRSCSALQQFLNESSL